MLNIGRFTAGLRDRLAQHLREEVKANTGKIAVLFSTHERSRSANLQVAHGNLHATAQILILVDGSQTCRCLFGKRHLCRKHKIRIRLLPTTAHAPLKLIQLSKSQALRIFNDQRVGMGIVDTRFNDGGCHQDIYLMLLKTQHHVFHLTGAHLSVCHPHARFRRRLIHATHRIINGRNAIGDVIYLAFTCKLDSDGGGYKIGIVLSHRHLNRLSSRRWRHDEAHIAHAAHGHLHRAWNRRCGKCQYVNLLAHVFKLLFMLNAKALLLVNNHKTQIMRVYVR